MTKSNFLSINLILLSQIGLSACTPSNTELKFSDAKLVEMNELNYSSSLSVSRRHFVESVFVQVFSIPESDPDRTTISTAIFEKKDFGGGCDRYGVSEITVNGTVVDEFRRYKCINGITPESPPTSNPMRYAWAAKACETMIVSKPVRLSAAMNKIIPGWAPNATSSTNQPNAETVAKAYDLFFQGRTADPEVIQSLIALGQTATTADQSWKLILTALCVSPEWQALN